MLAIRIVLLIIFCFVIGMPIFSADCENISKDLECYDKGEKAYRLKDYDEAKKTFLESYSIKPCNSTAYSLSCVFYYLNEPTNALKYSKLAQEGEPALKGDYKENAKKIEMWARQNFANKKIEIIIDAKLDIPKHPAVFDVEFASSEASITKALFNSYVLLSKGKYDQAQKILEMVLQKDPGNPLALNNMASVMVGMKKFDKAETYLKEALPKAKGYTVEVNRVCTVGNICMAFKPVSGGAGNQDLEPLIKMNIEMVKGYMEAGPLPGSGLR